DYHASRRCYRCDGTGKEDHSGYNRNEELRRRERELLTNPPFLNHKNAFEWMGTCKSLIPDDATYPQWVDVVEFNRGFVSHVTCTAEDWLRYESQLYWYPGQTVTYNCPECEGAGLLNIETYNPGNTYGSHIRCVACGDRGRLDTPRPFVPTAQPLER